MYTMTQTEDGSTAISGLASFTPSLEPDTSYSYNTNGSHVTQDTDNFRSAIIAFAALLTPVIILTGIIGNTLSFIVFVTSSHLRHQSCSVYLAFLNVADAAFLMCLGLTWTGVSDSRKGICQAVVYLSFVSAFLSVWTVVCFTVERFVVVYFPLWRLMYCTRKRAMGVVLSLVVVSFLIYSFYPAITGVLSIAGRPVCTFIPEYMTILQVTSAIDTVITLALPSLLICIFNLFILLKVWRFLGDVEEERGTLTRQVSDRTGQEPERAHVELVSPRDASEYDVRIDSSEAPSLSRNLQETERHVPLISSMNSRPTRRMIHSGARVNDVIESRSNVIDREQRNISNNTNTTTRGQTSTGGHSIDRTGNHFLPHLILRSSSSSLRAANPARHNAGERRLALRRHNPRSQAFQIRTTRTLLTISTLFVVLNLPSHAVRMGVTFQDHSEPPSENLLLCQLVFQMLYYANFSGNFFMYCACSRSFRDAVRSLFVKWRIRLRA